MNKILKLFKNKKLLLSVVLVGVFVMASFAVGESVEANQHRNVPVQSGQAEIDPRNLDTDFDPDNNFSISDLVFSPIIFALNLFFGVIIAIEGIIIEIFTALLKIVIGYNGFVKSTAVQLGWTLVRDLTNLFFVVVLLIIAFGTILRMGDNYSIKKLLPKVLIMAVLVNFSLVIGGLLIDASQVVMLTFVAAFDETIGLNLFNTLKIFDSTSAGNIAGEFGGSKITDLVEVFVNNALAILFLFISMFTIVIMTLIFIARIVALWILLVLAPLPYVLFAFPKLKQYATTWWTEFTRYLIIGPVMAFFLWLAFAIINQGGFSLLDDIESGLEGTSALADNPVFIKILETGRFTDYVIAIAFLFAGMIAAQKAGVVGASMAGSVVNRARGIGTGLLRGTGIKSAKFPFQYLARKNNEKIYEGKKWGGVISPKLFNPAALGKAWVSRRKELHDRAKEGAIAGYQESLEKVFTGRFRGTYIDKQGHERKSLIWGGGVTTPLRLKQQIAEQGKYASDYKDLPKEKLSQMAAQLAQTNKFGKRSPEVQARLRAVVRTAFENGYDDDLLDNDYFRKMAPKDAATGELRHLSKEHYLTAFNDMVGDNEAGLNVLSSGDGVAHRTKHFAVAGLTQTDTQTGEIRMSDYDGTGKLNQLGKFKFDKTHKDNKSYGNYSKEAVKSQITEATKESGRQRGQWHFQGQTAVSDREEVDPVTGEKRKYRIAQRFDKLGQDMIDSKLTGQAARFIDEHYTGRSAMAEFGGDIGAAKGRFTGDKQRMIISGGKDNFQVLENIADIDKDNSWASEAYFRLIGGADYSKNDNAMEFELGDKVVTLGQIRKAREQGILQQMDKARDDGDQAKYVELRDDFFSDKQDVKGYKSPGIGIVGESADHKSGGGKSGGGSDDSDDGSGDQPAGGGKSGGGKSEDEGESGEDSGGGATSSSRATPPPLSPVQPVPPTPSNYENLEPSERATKLNNDLDAIEVHLNDVVNSGDADKISQSFNDLKTTMEQLRQSISGIQSSGLTEKSKNDLDIVIQAIDGQKLLGSEANVSALMRQIKKNSKKLSKEIPKAMDDDTKF